tara:strand:- start:8375 stop:13438 length:5064 start_codon:yes stop_codon:yes gene_type:complete
MARKDVNLVIRAKDEAEKVVNSITDAINSFTDAQKGLQNSSEKTEGSLSELGAAVGSLDKQLKSLDVGRALGNDLDKAAGAVARLEKNVESTQGELAQLNRSVERGSQVADRYSSKLQGAVAAQERQSAAVKEARAESKQLEAAYNSTVSAVDKLTRKQQKLPGQIAKQEAAVAKTAARYDELQAQMRGTAEPSATLVRNFEASERSLTQQTDKLNRLRAEYNNVESELRAAGSAAAIFATQSEQAAQSLARQETVLNKIDQNVANLQTVTKSASNEQNRLEGSLDKTTASLERQQQQLTEAEAKYVEIAEAAGRFDQALADSANASRGNLEEQLVQQGIAAREAREEFEKLARESREYANAATAAGPPTREASQQMQFLAQRADEAQFKLLAQEEALERMGNAYREIGNDLQSTAQGQARFIAAQEKLGTAMREVAEDGFRSRQAIRNLHSEAQRATGSVNSLAQASRRQADASSRGASETGRLADAYRQLYGDTRRSLSYTQRLRGEVLSLIAAYGGFYGVIELLRGVVDAYQTLEGAQARLNVAVGNDFEQSAKEMDFVRRTADRLGIELGVLATEYSKFAIATKDTNLEGAATRKIFVSVAEAARVNRSSVTEMSGVFTALTQIVSKGAVQMEELRQQLGDRLPGALKIMADGLGVTTGELVKLMENGQIGAEALIPFAEELERRFGPGLAESLQGVTTALGRLKNAAFQALVTFGRGGFIDSFGDLANTLTDVLQSAKFEEFAERASAAMGKLLDVIGFVAENFELFTAAAAGFLGLKLTPLIIAIATKMGTLASAAAGAAGSFAAFATGARTAGAAAATSAASVGRLTIALRALLSSTGIGLAITAISAGIGYWATTANEATEALVDHEKIIDEVRNAYDAVGGSVDEWREKLNELTRAEAEANLRRVEKALKDVESALDFTSEGNDSFLTNFFGFNLAAGQEIFNVADDYKAAIKEVVKQFKDGELLSKEFIEALDDVAQAYDDGSEESDQYAEAVIKAARELIRATDAQREASQVVRALGDDSEDAAKAFEELGNEAETASKSLQEMADEKAAKLKAAMDEIGKSIGQVANHLDYIEKSNALETLGNEAIKQVSSIEELVGVFERLQAARESLGNDYVGGALSGSLVDRIIGVESGGDPSAKNPNSSATGLGQFISSTWLRMFKQYFPDRAASLNDAAILALRENAEISRQMVGLYVEENAKSLQRAGAAVTDANLYLAHFLGPGGATSLINSAPGTMANSVLSSATISSNASILDGKTREEVIRWAQRKVGISETELSVVEAMQDSERERAEEARKEAERRAEEAAKQQEATDQRLSDGEFELEQQRLINQEREREAAIREAVREAKAADPNISEEELARIREQAAALYDAKNAQDALTKSKEKAAEAEERISQLREQRDALQDQFEIAQEEGDTALAEELRVKIQEVNAELIAAIENAKAMWQAVGGPEADTAIAKLDAAAANARRFGQEGVKSYVDWSRVGDLFVSGLTGAFEQFARAVAEGEDAGKAARDAFLKFAADFLIQIARMIIQQAIFNALQGALGGTGFGKLIGFGHTGGLVGSSRVGSGNRSRSVNPAIFAGAMRYHTGGIVGLSPGEVPIIAKQGEEMLTRDDPRHMLNGGLSRGGKDKSGGNRTRVVNAFDGTSFLEEALKTSEGEEVLLNYVTANRMAIRGALGV